MPCIGFSLLEHLVRCRFLPPFGFFLSWPPLGSWNDLSDARFDDDGVNAWPLPEIPRGWAGDDIRVMDAIKYLSFSRLWAFVSMRQSGAVGTVADGRFLPCYLTQYYHRTQEILKIYVFMLKS